MNVRKLSRSALTGALYVLLTIVSAPISSGVFQVRLSEALCVLPFLCPETAIGLFVGCFAANIITGAVWIDVILGSVITLISAELAVLIQKKHFSKWIVPAPAVILNALGVGFLLNKVYGVGVSFPLCALYVGAGQFIACYVLGMPLMIALERFGKKLFN